MRSLQSVRAEKLVNQKAAGFVSARIAPTAEDRPSIETWPQLTLWLGDTLKGTHELKANANCTLEVEYSLGGGSLHLSVRLYAYVDGITQFSVLLAQDGVTDETCAALNAYGLPAGTALQNPVLSLYDLAWAIADMADYQVEVNAVGEPWADRLRFTVNLDEDGKTVLQGDTAQARALLSAAAG